MRHRIIDWDHDERGGWVIYVLLKSPISQQEPVLEWWDEPEREGPPSPRYLYTIYHADVVTDVLAYHDWVDVRALSTFVGTPSSELQQMAQSDSVTQRAAILKLIVDYYGSIELDQYPIQLTGKELRKRWPVIFRGMGRR